MTVRPLQAATSWKKNAIPWVHPRLSGLLRKMQSYSFQLIFAALLFFVALRMTIGRVDEEVVKYVAAAITRKGVTKGSNVSNVSSVHETTFGTRADWGRAEEAGEFCQKILENPQPFNKECKRNMKNMSCAGLGGETLMFSQFKQDYYLYTRHFAELKRPGIYLDVATNDPVGISNTYFMDRCLRWKGICVEANPVYYERIHRMRSCHMVPTCVGKRDMQMVEFGLAGGAGAIIGESNKHTEKWEKRAVEVLRMKALCTTVQKVLDRGQVRVVDYLSLDVEGHELEVLMGVDWSRTRINVVTIEASGKQAKELEEWMEELGYKRHMPDVDERARKTGLLGEDFIFLHPDVVFGAPK